MYERETERKREHERRFCEHLGGQRVKVPRVSGAVGAKWRHRRVRSSRSSRSSASEYLSKSSMFWPDVPRILHP